MTYLRICAKALRVSIGGKRSVWLMHGDHWEMGKNETRDITFILLEVGAGYALWASIGVYNLF